MASNPTNMSESEFTSYLASHGINETKQRGDEISFPCPFSGCDDDHRNNEEFHCGFNLGNCTYNCFKCGMNGNYITLRKHFGDYEEYNINQKEKFMTTKTKKQPSLETRVKNAYNDTRERAREYFNERGINDRSIDNNMLGIWRHGDQEKLMIPIFNKEGEIAYLKLRRMPSDDSSEAIAKIMGNTTPPKYTVYPTGSKLILVGEDQLAKSTSSDVLICEGELDRIIAIQNGVNAPVVTGGGGAQTFKSEWIEQLKNMRNIYICMDRDEAGENGFNKLAERLIEAIPSASIYKVTLPFEDGDDCKDLTDYFVGEFGTADDLFTKYSEFHGGAKPIDSSQFKEMGVEDIANVLSSTIKYDDVSKVVTFLAMVLTYTESEQLNIMFNASSSTGKSYICHEVSNYFPQQDVYIYGKTTPTAFYYSKKLREVDPETGELTINTARRIMLFVEQMDTSLQINLRALLSHEKKRVPFAITNREKSGRNAAEEGYILGYPTAIFCSANTIIDEQEQTRCIILSPESHAKKVLAGIDTYIDKNCHKETFDAKLRSDEARRLLMERILYIKSLEVDTIDVDDSEYLKQCFINALDGNIPPGAMRGIHKFTALAKAMALVNAPFRTKDDKINVTRKDIDEAMKLWSVVCKGMAYSLPPQLTDLYENVILPVWRKKNKNSARPKDITIKELRAEYYKQNGSYPSMDTVRKQWLPTLEATELISLYYDKNGGDGREKMIKPLIFFDEDLEEKA